MYERDELREYIKNSELRIFNKKIKIRLSSELAKKYDLAGIAFWEKDREYDGFWQFVANEYK